MTTRPAPGSGRAEVTDPGRAGAPDSNRAEAVPDPRRSVPRTDELLADARLVAALDVVSADLVKAAVQHAQELVRTGQVAPPAAADAAVAALPTAASSLRRVLNATGVVLHTNLGRAALGPAAVQALTAAAGYVDVEFDYRNGRRGVRGGAAVDALRRRVPNAEAALLVNNGAAALLLCVAALAAGREVVISRGEMIEIGDGFRLPDLMTAAGARLREVGTTNRSRPDDYRAAVGPETAFILKIHPSNFRIDGFTSAVAFRELVGLGCPVVVDIGSGLLTPDALLADEPDAHTALSDGASLVTASGDKLLGGPQAGLLLGSRELIGQLRRHPMYRAVRVDKLVLAAMEATLNGPPTPTHTALHADAEQLRERTERLAATIRDAAGPAGGEAAELDVHVVRHDGVVGGGGAPGVVLPGWALSLPAALAETLRIGEPCIVGVVEHGRCLLDLRCVEPAADGELAAAVHAVIMSA